MKRYDVVIVGGGIAGGLLARHLKIARPELDVLLLEAASALTDLKVGESTVEVAAHYMIRRLGLGTYLYQHQLPKNGLRFFFDSEDKDLPLSRMSEIGSDHMPFHPSFQLERASFERDLARMNAEMGVEVRLGAKVKDVDLDPSPSGPGHRVVFEQGGELRDARGRWVVDASGRRQLLARRLDLGIDKETRLPTGAAWARYRGVAGLDAVPDEAWKRRVRHTSRHLSTNHMMYDGYWIWFIPLAGDLMSVGAVYDKSRLGEGPRTREALEAFLRGHRASRELLEGARLEDFRSYAHLPYRAGRYFSADRWALVGEAGAFTDPFYSPGSDFIATGNEFTVALVLADLDGRDVRPLADAYDAYYKFKYESTLLLYAGLYPVFGSYEVFRLKYLLDFNSYYNLVVWPFMADRITDPSWIEGELGASSVVLRALAAMGRHFSAHAEFLRRRGEYFAENEGAFANGLNGVAQFEARLGPEIDEAFRRDQVDRAFGGVFASILERISGVPGLSGRERILSELRLPQVTVWKELDEASASRLVGRCLAKVSRRARELLELPASFPLELSLDARSGSVRALGLPEGELRGRAEALAQELWDAPGEALTHVRL